MGFITNNKMTGPKGDYTDKIQCPQGAYNQLRK